ncbi:IPT/TIG domain-containing protein [uncultured Tenacibaculum sp.]|uniref:IPT/TIG domain-containing protein n=1 Tax=uncultured Tenacibaculum sp. TaxID=174713 RepID=UPI002613BEB2|nr:IPT/TIG domain-containing protein [uncultured Tenacibaculum sp.]
MIEKISPQSAGIGDEITIQFSGLPKNTQIDHSSVKFNDIESEITNISNNEIKCIVPPHAKDGEISIKVNNYSTTSSEKFSVKFKKYPQIHYFSKGSFAYGGFSLRKLNYNKDENTYDEQLISRSPKFSDRIKKIVYNKEHKQFIIYIGQCPGAYFTYNLNTKRWNYYNIYSSCSSSHANGVITIFIDSNQNKTYSFMDKSFDRNLYLSEIDNEGKVINIKKLGENLYSSYIESNLFIPSKNAVVYFDTEDEKYFLHEMNTTTNEFTKKEVKVNTDEFDLLANTKLFYLKKSNSVLIVNSDSDSVFQLNLNNYTVSKINTSGEHVSFIHSINISPSTDYLIINNIRGYIMDLTSFKIEKINSSMNKNVEVKKEDDFIIID